MKTIFFILFILQFSILFSQTGPDNPCPTPDGGEDIIGHGDIFTSSYTGSNSPGIDVTDGNFLTSAITSRELNPYLQVNFNEIYRVPYIILNGASIPNQLYVFTSQTPIKLTDDLSDILSNPYIVSNQIFNFRSGDTIFIDGSSRSLRIQLNGEFQLEISELRGPGEPLEKEICDNGRDDNCDGKIDCDDIQCGAQIFNVSVVNASCPVCNDGEIHIQPAFGENLEFSIDGGVTWSSLCWDNFENMCFWKGLIVGNYSIKIRNSVSGCTSDWPETVVVNSSPPDPDDSPCENGGFEEGTFHNWTGATGIHDIPGHINWTNNNIGLNTQHFIRNSQTFVDQNLGMIGTQYPGLGSYFAQLGDDKIGGNAAMLNYCITVDANDPFLRFLYAVVLKYNELHAPLVQAFFQWTVYRNDGQPIGPGNIIGSPFKVVADINNPYFHRTGFFNDIVYKGWTCEEIDLSNFIGQSVCIQFIASDCQEMQHFGYAFIDGLCSTPEDLAPTVQIGNIPKFCLGENISVNVTGNGFNHYSWRISKIDDHGDECCIETIDEIGENASIGNLVDYYEDNSNNELGCGGVKIKVTAYNDCSGIATDEADIKIECEDFDVDYCNLIPICDYYSNQQILGHVGCEDCTYTWTPEQYLNYVNGDKSQPWIDLIHFPYASEETFHVTVQSPLGCAPHEEDIKLIDLSKIEMSFDTDVYYCSYDVIVTVDTKFDIPNQYVTVKLEETVKNEFFNMTLDASTSTGNIKVFKYTVKRDHNTFLYAHAKVDLSYFGDCTTESFCTHDLTIGTEPKSNYLGPWKVYLPNIFSPNGDGHNDIWSPFPSGHSIECNAGADYSVINNNIYGMKVSVWDRWGGLQWQKELFKGIYDSQGILSTDMQWDGTGFNNIPLQSGVYVVVVEIWSCYGTAGYNICFADCACMPEGQGPHDWPCNGYCNDSSHEIISIGVTIVH